MNQSDNYTLKDTEVNEIVDVLSTQPSEDIEFIRSLPSNNGVLEASNENECKESIREVTYDVNTGTNSPGVEVDYKDMIDDELAALLGIDENFVPDSMDDIKIKEEDIISNASNTYGISEEDAMVLVSIVDRYRKKETFSVYNAMPDSVKKIIDRNCIEVSNHSKEARTIFAESIVEGLIQDSGMDNIIAEFDETVGSAFGSGALNKYISLDTKNKMDKLIVEADELEAKGDIKNAEKRRNVYNAYYESYYITELKKAIPKIKIKKIDYEKFDRVCEEFNFKYENNKYFSIHDIKKITPSLQRIYGDKYNNNIIVGFVICFCKFCMNKKSYNISDHTFMSYFILNVINMNIVKDDLDEMSQILYNSIDECMEMVSKK